MTAASIPFRSMTPMREVPDIRQRDRLRRDEKQGHEGGVWRVEFRCLGADDRIARRNDAVLRP
jgi:hypothetical protein